jgi:hypothetical protein
MSGVDQEHKWYIAPLLRGRDNHMARMQLAREVDDGLRRKAGTFRHGRVVMSGAGIR